MLQSVELPRFLDKSWAKKCLTLARGASILRPVQTLPAGCKYADHLLDGSLAQRIRGWRADGESWDRIARNVWQLTDGRVDVTGPTIRTWAALIVERAA